MTESFRTALRPWSLYHPAAGMFESILTYKGIIAWRSKGGIHHTPILLPGGEESYRRAEQEAECQAADLLRTPDGSVTAEMLQAIVDTLEQAQNLQAIPTGERDPLPSDFIGKTITGFDGSSWNLWRFQFSYGTSLAIEAENHHAAGPGLQVCVECGKEPSDG